MKSAAQALRWAYCSFNPGINRSRHVCCLPDPSWRSFRAREAFAYFSLCKRNFCCPIRTQRATVSVSASSVQSAPSSVQSAPRQPSKNTESVSLENVEDRLGALSTNPTVPAAAPVVVVLSGPSGVGKDAVINALKEARSDLFFVVTATSRQKREGEVHGKDYIFVSKEEFEGWIAGDQLLEHAVVYGDYKGIPRQQVAEALSRGTDVVMRVDVQGAATIRRLLPHSILVFLVAESEKALVQRLTQRKTEPMEAMLVRVQTARQEIGHMATFDYVVVNREGRLSATVQKIGSIIDAEKSAVQRRLSPAA